MAAAAPNTRADTKERILDAAERLFVEKGFAGTSLRAVTAAAGANVAAIHYHFGGREQLLRAALERRIRPINEARLTRLDALERAPGRPTLESVLHAFVDPLLEEAAGEGVPQLAGMLFYEPATRAMVPELFAHIAARMEELLAQALPELPHSVIRDRMPFIIGAVVFQVVGHHPLEPDRPSAGDGDEMIRFLAAGMRAPASAAERTATGGTSS